MDIMREKNPKSPPPRERTPLSSPVRGKRISYKILLFLGSFLPVLVTCGCTHSFRFNVVDARSGAPLQVVVVHRESKSDDILLGSKRSSGDVAPSDSGGMVLAAGLPSNMVHMFIFRRPGYQDAEVIWQPPPGEHLLLLSPSPGPRDATFTEIHEEPLITIPMHPIPPPTATQTNDH